jgi:hypothetical protein
MKTLDEFGGGVHGDEKKKVGKVRTFIMKWNLTKESLTDRNGRPISEGIIVKSMKQIEMDVVRKVSEETLGNGFIKQVWVCDPIEGYNSTAYTINITNMMDAEVVVGCNCQYGGYDKLCSHALSSLILAGLDGLPRIVRGGVRDG